MIDIVLALEEKGIGHRDIKPKNILVKLNKDNRVKKFALTDYSESATNEEKKSIAGSRNYMSSELIYQNAENFYNEPKYNMA